MLNSRMKDSFDLWAISGTFPFEGIVLSEAIRATFDRRATPLPTGTPIAQTNAFAEDACKQAQWRAFLGRTAIALAPEPLPDLLRHVAAFVMPPTGALLKKEEFPLRWQPGIGWT